MLAALAALVLSPASILIQGATVVDGSGRPGFQADVRILGDTIRAVGKLDPVRGEQVLAARGLTLAPGFIDAHSHADGGILETPLAPTTIRQGITTAIVGQDGGHPMPLEGFIRRVREKGVAVNLASFAGHGAIRSAVMGNDFQRKATSAEIARMKSLLVREMDAGALGLSSGLEYDPGLFATTDEVVELAEVAAKVGGIYISHVRDEENEAFASFAEAIEVGRRAKLPVQISHIKLASAPVWGRAREALGLIERARANGVPVTADVYPYTFWQSTIRVLIPHRDFSDRKAWEVGLAEIGGPQNVRLTAYTPNPAWVGRTVADLAKETGRDPVELIQEIVAKTADKGRESVVVQAMQEADLRVFLRDPRVMFCSDGGIGGRHPRAAGSFPRILGKYVRDEGLLRLEEAVRKMTSFPARRFGLTDRGMIREGAKADLVLFDPRAIADRATLEDPGASPSGIAWVMVNGQIVIRRGEPTGARPGRFLTRTSSLAKR